ncbi:conserved hypothetical protein [Candidatus Desulfarcum epimagneticum]|uniref:Methyltransferase domain-containing protein n=1 Tax=uncultured Desulfobacteraceae bacterium TaxID=218296 RepID=A0A484HJM7_9BACT|nr:conserved hypothetical protein [uncultured Desulfobacteraceae bacterium]
MSEKTIKHFDSDSYYKLFSIFGAYDRQLIKVLKSMLISEPAQILDMACGVGLSTVALRDNFPDSKITGVDIDSELIGYSKSKISCDGIEFKCSDISDLLAETPDKPIDLIFVKSAYHYFDKEITISDLKSVLGEHGVIAVAERTSHSARSYPLPDIVSGYWGDIFSEPRPTRRFDAADLSEMELSVSSFGSYVTIPADIYLDAVKKNQLVGLWLLKPDVVNQWIKEQISKKTDSLKVYEEFRLYLYQNKAV